MMMMDVVVVVVMCPVRTGTGTSPPPPDFLLDIRNQIFSLLYPCVKTFLPEAALRLYKVWYSTYKKAKFLLTGFSRIKISLSLALPFYNAP
jgi:hypothetical protein